MRKATTSIRVAALLLWFLMVPSGFLSGSPSTQSDLPSLEIVSSRFTEKVQGKYVFENTTAIWQPKEPGFRTGLIVTIAKTSSGTVYFNPQKLVLLYTIGSSTFEEELTAFHSTKSKEPEDGGWTFVKSPVSRIDKSGTRPDDSYIHLLFEVGRNAEVGTEITVAFIGPVLKSKPVTTKKTNR